MFRDCEYTSEILSRHSKLKVSMSDFWKIKMQNLNGMPLHFNIQWLYEILREMRRMFVSSPNHNSSLKIKLSTLTIVMLKCNAMT